jgi:hypothetical protein
MQMFFTPEATIVLRTRPNARASVRIGILSARASSRRDSLLTQVNP